MLAENFYLDIYRPDAPQVQCRLHVGSILVGRAHQVALRLAYYGVSGRHCLLRVEQAQVTIEDLGSTNGTFVNGNRLPSYVPVPLTRDDRVQIGPFYLALTTVDSGASRRLPLEIGAAQRDQAAAPSAPRRPKQSITQQLDLSRLSKGEVLLGRASDCDIKLDHPAVSRYHARLRRRHAGWLVEDLGSVAGTFVDGVRLVRPMLLREGQKLEIVGHRFAISGRRLVQVGPGGVQSIDAVGLGMRVRDGKIILRGISLHAQAGEFVAIVGPSGAGKTTLLNALSGYAPASQGQVLFDGRDLYRHYDLLRSQIGYVPQRDILHKSLPLERALLYSARLRLPDRSDAPSHTERVDEVIQQLGLSRVRRQTIDLLSGGECKRANLAAELIVAPSTLFLDEPTAGLDAEVEQALMGQLRTLADSGKIVIVCTHATQNVMLCDLVAVIGTGGYLLYYGPPEEALDYFQVKTFPEILRRISPEGAPRAWAKTYLGSAACDRYVRQPQAGMLHLETPARLERSPGVRRPPRLRQTLVLTARYVDLLTRDRRNLLMLLLQAPAIGLLMPMGFTRTAFSTGSDGDIGDAIMILFFLSLVPVWLGIFNATREIVKEADIYRRERMATIDVWPYLFSKLIVLSAVGAIQVVSLLLVASFTIDLPLDIFADHVRWFTTLTLATLLGTGMGLLISSSLKTLDKVNAAMLFMIIPQMLLAGAFVTVSKMDPVTRFLSAFIPARWTFEALGAQIDILSIYEQQGHGPSSQWGFLDTFQVDVTAHLVIMLSGLILLLTGTYIALRCRDPL
ncbi:MAG: FHA domain-containing protein [Anaerolineae bacterium]|nr:FHA domain-containing protein [Anaerolineae bacterium]